MRDTAAHHLVTRAPTARPLERASDTRSRLVGSWDSAEAVYFLDEDQLVGGADPGAPGGLGRRAACSTGGLLFPWALHRLGRDPALGSGPLATIIQDVLSLLVYFGCVELFL